MDVYMNTYVSEAAIPQIVAILYCKRKKKESVSHLSLSRLCASLNLLCRISAHSCPSYTSLAFALFPFLLSQSTTKLPLKHGPNTTYFLALVKPNRVKTHLAGRLQRGPPGAPPAGPHHQPGGAWVAAHWSGPMYWHMTLPVFTVRTVLARATRAQP